MSVPHSSTPWKVSPYCPTLIYDSEGRNIVAISGSNEQSIATTAHIVRVVNEWHEQHADAENERHAADR
jgi:hypothetical protein